MQKWTLFLKLMNPDELHNWKRVKEYFETLPEFKRDNMFYKRACAIVSGKSDPLPPPPITDKHKE